LIGHLPWFQLLRLLCPLTNRDQEKPLIQREFPETPLIGVGAVIVDDSGRVLLIRRATEPLKGHWSIPGGLVELGESLVEAVCREVKEETGLIVNIEAVVEVVDRIYKSSDVEKSPVRYHYVIVDYWCQIIGGVLEPLSDASEVAWVGRAEWIDCNVYSLEAITVQVIEKGWQMAQEARRSCSEINFFGG
jgi:8-oxo-dGTP diphosphatase